jgi:hypothetical protein
MTQPRPFRSDPDEQRSFLDGDLFAGIAPTLPADSLSGLVGGGGDPICSTIIIIKTVLKACTSIDCSYGCTGTCPSGTGSACLCSFPPNCSRVLDC